MSRMIVLNILFTFVVEANGCLDKTTGLLEWSYYIVKLDWLSDLVSMFGRPLCASGRHGVDHDSNVFQV
jgi:hypothetical protein